MISPDIVAGMIRAGSVPGPAELGSLGLMGGDIVWKLMRVLQGGKGLDESKRNKYFFRIMGMLGGAAVGVMVNSVR